MTRRSVLLLMILALVPAMSACGEDGGSVFAGTAAAGDDGSSFEGTPGIVPESAGTIAIEAAGETWELPAAVCLRADGDDDIVLASAQQAAAVVRSLVGHLVSGWPTTTWARDFDYEAYARDLNRAAVTALALAEVIGEQDAPRLPGLNTNRAMPTPARAGATRRDLQSHLRLARRGGDPHRGSGRPLRWRIATPAGVPCDPAHLPRQVPRGVAGAAYLDPGANLSPPRPAPRRRSRQHPLRRLPAACGGGRFRAPPSQGEPPHLPAPERASPPQSPECRRHGQALSDPAVPCVPWINTVFTPGALNDRSTTSTSSIARKTAAISPKSPTCRVARPSAGRPSRRFRSGGRQAGLDRCCRG